MNSSHSTRFTFLIAPGGYGKTWFLNAQAKNHQGPILRIDGEHWQTEGDFWQQWRQRAAQQGLPVPVHDHPEAWLACWYDQPLLLQLDQWHILARQPAWQTWLHTLLYQTPTHWRLSLSSRRCTDIVQPALCAAGHALYLDATALRWSVSYFQQLFQDAHLSWEAQEHREWERQEGWPLGCALYLRLRQGLLSEEGFHTLLNQAVDQLFAEVGQDWQELLNPAYHAELCQWRLAPEQWLPLWRQRVFSHLLLSAQAWMVRALQGQPTPIESQTLLQRSLALCKPAEAPLRLSILTRLAHLASLEARWSDLDQALAHAEPLLEQGYVVDQAAWYYQKANRARQCCLYGEVERWLDKLFALRADSRSALNLQVRGHILQGLSAYQQGDYARTRRCYEQARILAQADENTQMLLELEIMLAFLDALQGIVSPLASDIVERVAAQPLPAQPMMWLNLAFLWILGEHLDLNQGRAILERVRHCTQMLQWTFLQPFIADVEARLWRFHKDYTQAHYFHEQALSQLAPGTFEYLHALLNQALTYSRQGEKQQAIELLQQVITEAEQNGSLGLSREALAALQVLQPAQDIFVKYPENQPQAPQRVQVLSSDHLHIQTLGGFGVERAGQSITHWPRKRARHILIQLLFHPHGIHRETLADWLFGGDEPEQALRQLDVHIHSLRKILEPERKGKQASKYILFQHTCYSFNWHCDYFWDYQELNRLSQLWLRQRETDPEAAWQAAEAALQLYQGPLLPELDFADDWLTEREGLERRIADLVQWSIPWLCQQGAPEQAEELANRLLSLDACSEAGFAALLQIAAHRKSLSWLKRIGHQMREAFARQWELPPPVELEQLYQRLEKTLSG